MSAELLFFKNRWLLPCGAHTPPSYGFSFLWLRVAFFIINSEEKEVTFRFIFLNRHLKPRVAFFNSRHSSLERKTFEFLKASFYCVSKFKVFIKRRYTKNYSEHMVQRCKRDCCELKFPAENSLSPPPKEFENLSRGHLCLASRRE